MGNWAYLRWAGAPLAKAQLGESTVLLAAKYEVPVLWPALIDATNIVNTPRRWDWFGTRCGDAVARLRALVTSLGEDPFFGVVWESLSPMIEWLAALDASSWLVLDLREIAEIVPDGALRPQVAGAAETFLELRLGWSPDRARALLPRWLDVPDVAAATLAARYHMRMNEPRGALFSAVLGWPQDPKIETRRWRPWIDAGPSAPPRPSPLDEAAQLRDLLARRRLVVFTDTSRARLFLSRYLATAAGTRRAETLLAALDAMTQAGVVRQIRRDLVALADALTALEYGVGA